MYDSVNFKKGTVYRNRAGTIETIQVHERVKVRTSVGDLVPRYTLEEQSRKKEAPVKLYKSGKIKSLPLEEATIIESPLGPFSAELITFYESGAVRRIFPLNGKLSGYWTEKDEYKLARVAEIPTPLGKISVKPIFIEFYESGILQSVVFWPDETVSIETPVGKIPIRGGLTFHEDGGLASCTLLEPVMVDSPIGSLEVFDPDPGGLHSEKGPLRFDPEGRLQSLMTVKNEVVVEGTAGKRVYSPGIVTSYCDDTVFSLVPLTIVFTADDVRFMRRNSEIGKEPHNSDFQVTIFKPDCTIRGPGCES